MLDFGGGVGFRLFPSPSPSANGRPHIPVWIVKGGVFMPYTLVRYPGGKYEGIKAMHVVDFLLSSGY